MVIWFFQKVRNSKRSKIINPDFVLFAHPSLQVLDKPQATQNFSGVTRYLVKYFMNNYCCNSRTKDDIHMKLGSVSSIEKRKKLQLQCHAHPHAGFSLLGGWGSSPSLAENLLIPTH